MPDDLKLHMVKKELLLTSLPYSIIAAILYCPLMTFFLNTNDYGNIYLLYIGNVLFLCGIVLFLVHYNRKRNKDASASSMLIAGHITTALGVIFAVVLTSIIVLLIFPHIIHPHTTEMLINAAPSQPVAGRHEGLRLVIFMNAILGNVFTGSFVSLLLPYTMKRDQTKDKTTEV